jgi:hypothetical protein
VGENITLHAPIIMTSYFRESQAPHLLAQKLNEHAAFCIEIGCYDRAISTLVQALQLSEQTNHTRVCQCHSCSLESCMAFSQQTPEGICVTPKKNDQKLLLTDHDSSEEGFIHRKPIRVTPKSMQEGHRMGLVFPVIVTFNLALAHHLSAVDQRNMIRAPLQKVLQLYELAYRWQMEEHDSVQLSSLRFTMIIANNLGEIHRAVKNHSKHQKCMQHLLSTMMFVVDCPDDTGSNCSNKELEDFFRNTSRLILQEHCAGAA